MGCGGSKFETEGETVPVRVRPLLRRRIEEIKRRRNAHGLKDSTPSKKELLHNDDAAGDEDDENDSSPPHSLHEDGHKSVSSPPDAVKIIVEHVEEERSLKPEEKEESITRDNEKTEEVKSIADSEEDEDDDEGGEYDEEGMLSNDEGYICPGSPSFRVYYEESLINKNDNDDDDDSKNEGTINESSQGDESIASTNSTECSSVTKTTKKGMKVRNFRRVMHKGGHVAVKKVLSVKSCYNPAASSQDNTRLLQKAAA